MALILQFLYIYVYIKQYRYICQINSGIQGWGLNLFRWERVKSPFTTCRARGVLLLPRSSSQPRWLSGLRRSRVHSLMIARRSLCPEKLGSNPGQGSKGINFSGWHGLDMSITVTKRR